MRMIAVLRGLILLALPAAFAQQQASPFLSVPAVSDTLRFDAPLPDFEAKDIAGRTWRLEDLRGKFTLVYLWWTDGARAMDGLDPFARSFAHSSGSLPDLPEVQRFYDKAKNTSNIQVLTFCGDYDYTHAPEYIRQAKYTFPVIADWVLLRKLFSQRWNYYLVVNPEGRLSYPIRYWSLGRVLMEIEKAAAAN
jgi:peroxiredoxin